MRSKNQRGRHFLPDVRGRVLERLFANASRNALYASALALLLLGAYLLETRVRHQEAIAYFSEALQHEHIEETVVASGVSYLVKDGAVSQAGAPVMGMGAYAPLRLAYEKTLARRSPILSLAGVDSTALRAAIERLQKTQTDLAALQETPAAADMIRTSLFPIGFLKSAAMLEESRTRFLATGSDQDARQYEHLVETTLALEASELDGLVSAYPHAVPETIRPYASAGLRIDRSSMRSAFDALRAGIEHARIEFRARLACMQGRSASCNPSDLALPGLSLQPVTVSASDLRTARTVREEIARATRAPAISDGPLIVLAHSTCLAGSSLPPIFTIYTGSSFIDGRPQTTLLYVGDIRFWPATLDPNVPYESFYASQHINYIPSDVLAYYSCPYLGSDYGKAYAIQAVSQRAAADPLSAYASGAAQKALQQFEQKLLPSNALLTETDAVSYVNAARAFATTTEGSPELERRAAELALMLAYPSAGFVPLLERFTEITERNIVARALHDLPVDLSAETMFYFRNPAISFFMGDNASVIASADSFFPEYFVPKEQQPFVYFSDLKGTPRAEEVLADFRIYLDFHRLVGTTP